MSTIVLKPDDIIYLSRNKKYVGKIIRVVYTQVKVNWDDLTSTREDICMDACYEYIGNLNDNDFDKKLLAFRLKGFSLPDVSQLKEM